MKKTSYIFLFLMLTVMLLTGTLGCRQQTTSTAEEEDKEAKQLLQGVWINADDESLTMKVKGDTIYYADSTSMPAYFMIIRDSLILKGSEEQHLPIIKQSAHVFQFKNASGDLINLQKTDDASMASAIDQQKALTVHHNDEVVKKDTTIAEYRVTTEVSPTNNRVLHSTLNSDGVAVDNVYYDNNVHLEVFYSGKKIYWWNYHKKDFLKYIPADYNKEGILSDIVPISVDADGLHLDAYIWIPDSPADFIVHLVVSSYGKVAMSVDK